MIKGRDIIVFGLQPWDLNIASTCKYTSMEFARHNRVIYVNPPLQRSVQILKRNLPEIQKRLKILKGKEPDLVRESENIWVLYPRTVVESINMIKSPKIFDRLNKMNDKRLAKKILEVVKKLDFKDYILFNDNSMIVGHYLKEFLKPKTHVYLLRDAVTLVSYHARHGKRLQPNIIRKSDVVVTNSEFFAEYARETNPNSNMIGQGCDVSMYSDPDGTLKIPDDLAPIKKPIIGYVGFLTTIRLDIDVLVHIAEQLTDKSLVLVGPEDEDFKNSKLHELPNVYFLGRKDPHELPAYIKGFDVALNPQKVNPITDINYPLKIDEYLAMGKPTVATKTTFMAYFKDHTYLPTNKEEYVESIKKALEEDSPELVKKRIAYAGEHTWENFVKKIYKYVEDFESKLK